MTVNWPPTNLVDIGDRKVCARVMGHCPTVVLEAGGAGEGTSETFSGTVEEQLAEFATVVTARNILLLLKLLTLTYLGGLIKRHT